MDEVQQREFERLLCTEPYKGALAMNVTPFEKGIEKGIERGRRESLRELLEELFGPLTPSILEQLDTAPLDQIHRWNKAASKATSLAELGFSKE
jgi:hypothetical protein